MASFATVSHSGIEQQEVLKTLVDPLLTLLEQERELYQELRAIIYREKDILRRPSLEEINQINEKKEACIRNLQKFEGLRVKAVRKIAAFFRVREGAVTISFLLPHLSESLREALVSVQKNLFSLIAEIKTANGANGDVVDHSLSRVEKSLHFIHDLRRMKSGYSNLGKISAGGPNGILISGEV